MPADESARMPRPYGLLAELTHACPLHCPYCSNPLELARRESELAPSEWERVMREASELGVVQVGLSGGEPLAYPGLDRVVAAVAAHGMYSNLITSGVGLTSERARRLADAGLDAVQVSFQADDALLGNEVAGARAHESKQKACQAIRDAGLPLGVNVVLHRQNITRVRELVELAESFGAIRIELANVQLAGWAWQNRLALLPTRAQVLDADRIAAEEAERLRGRMQVIYVLPDLHGVRPKPCLHGWGQRGLTVNPRGDVMPCQAAEAIPGMEFDSIREASLAWIWRESRAFQRFRGTDWMPEPCRSCPERERDFGGCRCQAALFTGDPARTDPVCEFSPDRSAVDALLAEIEAGGGDAEWVYRSFATSSGVTASS